MQNKSRHVRASLQMSVILNHQICSRKKFKGHLPVQLVFICVACLFRFIALRTSFVTCVACLLRLMVLRTSDVTCVACLYRLAALRTSYVTFYISHMGKIDDPKVEVISLVVHADMVRCAVMSLFDPCVEVTYFIRCHGGVFQLQFRWVDAADVLFKTVVVYAE